MRKRLTTQEFIERANKVHNGKYDYSKAIFVNTSSNVTIICPIHGEFVQNARNHYRGSGCPKCAGNYLDQEYFIQKANIKHNGRYDYSKVKYVDSSTLVEIVCKRHGSFLQKPNSHLMGCGCPKCGVIDSRGKILGVGINDVDDFMNHEKSYILWSHLFARCYNPKALFKHPAYNNVIVCKEWHLFSNFLKWFETQKEWYQQGWHIDKDILVKGNREYAPDKCCFVPQEINALFTNRKRNKGKYPIGVSYIKSKNKFVVSVAYNGRNKTIGAFNTPTEAFYAYKEAKEKRIKEVADKWKDQLEPKVYEALYNYKVEITD